MNHEDRFPTITLLPHQNQTRSRWLGDTEIWDEYTLLINELAKRCVRCGRSTRIEYLDEEQHCPDCRYVST